MATKGILNAGLIAKPKFCVLLQTNFEPKNNPLSTPHKAYPNRWLALENNREKNKIKELEKTRI